MGGSGAPSAASAAGAAAAAAGEKVELRALVILSRHPVYELWRTMLHTIYARGESLLGPPGTTAALYHSPVGREAPAAPQATSR